MSKVSSNILGYIDAISSIPEWLNVFSIKFDEQIAPIYIRRFINEDYTLNSIFIYMTEEDFLTSFIANMDAIDNYPENTVTSIFIMQDEDDTFFANKKLAATSLMELDENDEKMLEISLEAIAKRSFELSTFNEILGEDLLYASIDLVKNSEPIIKVYSFNNALSENLYKITDESIIEKLKGLTKNNYSVDVMLNYNYNDLEELGGRKYFQLELKVVDSINRAELISKKISHSEKVAEVVLTTIYDMLCNIGAVKRVRTGSLSTYLMLEHLCKIANIDIE